MALHNKIGNIGEEIACKFLVKKGFEVIERNYWQKWGEIDIIVRDDDGIVRFVEVKTTSKDFDTSTIDSWRPEEMIHSRKIQRLRRVIQTYILQNNINEWVFDIIIVYLNRKTRMARCNYIKDIVL